MFELGIELNKIGVDEKSICHVLKPAVNLDFIAENANEYIKHLFSNIK